MPINSQLKKENERLEEARKLYAEKQAEKRIIPGGPS